MKAFFGFLLSFGPAFSEWLENRSRDRETRKIKLPILTQQHPLITDEASVKDTLARLKKFHQQPDSPIGSCGITRKDGSCKLHIMVSETLTPEQENVFREIIGNTAVEMTAGILYLHCA